MSLLELMARTRPVAMRYARQPALRNAVKSAARAGARVRGLGLAATASSPNPAVIFLAGPPKAGSQWVKAVFDHPVVRRHTGLFCYPQLDYQDVRPRAFPAGVLVPGLYVGYQHYRLIPKPPTFRTVYLFRDPRALVVSGYFSALESHADVGGLQAFRKRLRDMPRDIGLLRFTELMAFRLREMSSWVDAVEPELMCRRLEDVAQDERGAVAGMLRHCGVKLEPHELDAVLEHTARASLQAQDLAGRAPGAQSHYRVEPLSFAELFDERHHALVEQIAPGLISRLGY